MNATKLNDELPDDLAMLAAQLGDDADTLAGLYPPRAPQFVPVVVSGEQMISAQPNEILRPMPVWMRWSAAAAILVCAVWGASMSTEEQPITVTSPQGSIADRSPRTLGPTRTSLQPSAVDAEVYENLTAPAREALLDMWEADSTPQASLSI